MKNFKQLFVEKAFNTPLENSSVSLKSEEHELFIRFDSKDTIVDIAYSGKTDPWLSSLCFLAKGKTLNEASHLSFMDWDQTFKEDQSYWDLKEDSAQDVFFPALDLLSSALDIFRGREYLYQSMSPLICRCFGVREDDVLDYLKKENHPSVEGLGEKTKAGMGCRSCKPQIERWFVKEGRGSTRHFKGRSVADWLLLIDEVLVLFPRTKEWKMEVESFRNGQVIISYVANVSQKEEEEVTKNLQGFLGSGVDPELSFFLRRSLQR